ncbi:MAG: hypothetical protein ABA06_04525 [Parcubacteria bacterium C7867-001]|nr:MAG: hypothetical protein ABA06_04525 [Parcubacteria bacterium C7867-001]
MEMEQWCLLLTMSQQHPQKRPWKAQRQKLHLKKKQQHKENTAAKAAVFFHVRSQYY